VTHTSGLHPPRRASAFLTRTRDRVRILLLTCGHFEQQPLCVRTKSDSCPPPPASPVQTEWSMVVDENGAMIDGSTAGGAPGPTHRFYASNPQLVLTVTRPATRCLLMLHQMFDAEVDQLDCAMLLYRSAARTRQQCRIWCLAVSQALYQRSQESTCVTLRAGRPSLKHHTTRLYMKINHNSQKPYGSRARNGVGRRGRKGGGEASRRRRGRCDVPTGWCRE